jgi:hypothetical protein
MKSPVYGLGRNRKHKPRGSTNHPSAANVNMRGKKLNLCLVGAAFVLTNGNK